MNIEVSDKASEKIAKILLSANTRHSFLRVGVEEGDAVDYLIPLSWTSSKQRRI